MEDMVPDFKFGPVSTDPYSHNLRQYKTCSLLLPKALWFKFQLVWPLLPLWHQQPSGSCFVVLATGFLTPALRCLRVCVYVHICICMYSYGLPRWISGKESTGQCRRHRRCRYCSWVREIPWRRKWQPTLIFLPGKSHGQRNLIGYSPWGHKESDTAERARTHTHPHVYIYACVCIWCWSWNSNTLATSCEELTQWKRPWCWEGLEAGGEGDDRGWDCWRASPTQWTWVWVNSRSWWWTGRPGMLQFMGLQRVGHDWATELNWTDTCS